MGKQQIRTNTGGSSHEWLRKDSQAAPERALENRVAGSLREGDPEAARQISRTRCTGTVGVSCSEHIAIRRSAGSPPACARALHRGPAQSLRLHRFAQQVLAFVAAVTRQAGPVNGAGPQQRGDGSLVAFLAGAGGGGVGVRDRDPRSSFFDHSIHTPRCDWGCSPSWPRCGPGRARAAGSSLPLSVRCDTEARRRRQQRGGLRAPCCGL